jgi:hypothetical protein
VVRVAVWMTGFAVSRTIQSLEIAFGVALSGKDA